jgi:hypothetical protein
LTGVGGLESTDFEIGEKTSGFIVVGGTGAHGPGVEKLGGIQATTLIDSLAASVFLGKIANVIDFTINR